MINSTIKKKLIHDVLSYFIDTTGEPVESFILMVTRNNKRSLEELSYKEWLAIKCFNMLQEKGINLSDCVDYRELASQLKLEKRGMNITSLWKDKIADFLNCDEIEQYTLFDVSDNDSELSFLGRKIDKPVYCFEDVGDRNFFNTFDFDKDTRTLYNMLPTEVQNSVAYNNYIFINVNPYIEQQKDIDALIEEMRFYSFSEKALLNIFYGTMFKLMRMCKDYNLSNVRIGFYSPLDMFNEDEKYKAFYKEFRSIFKFKMGVCFDPKQIGVKSKDKLIGYTVWETKKDKNEMDNAVMLKELKQHTDDTILEGSTILLRAKTVSLYDWVKNGILKYGDVSVVPIYNNIQVRSEETVERYKNELGYLLNSVSVFRNFKKIGVFSVPIKEYTEITKENLLKSVASFVVCSCLASFDETHSNPPYLSMPDISINGYKNWQADALIYFMFSLLNKTKSYRERDLVLSNRTFPLTKEEASRQIRDFNLLDDIQVRHAENEDFLEVFNSVFKDVTLEGKELYDFCREKLLQSLSGTYRENVGYKDSLVAWDASFYQIKGIPNLFLTEDEKKYHYLLSKLKDKLSEGIYKYGFVNSEI